MNHYAIAIAYSVLSIASATRCVLIGPRWMKFGAAGVGAAAVVVASYSAASLIVQRL